MSLLVARDLSAGYDKLTILRELDFSIEKGEVAVVLGANGAGKTTTLRALCGTTWRRGTIMLEGRDISRLPTASIAAAGVAQSAPPGIRTHAAPARRRRHDRLFPSGRRPLQPPDGTAFASFSSQVPFAVGTAPGTRTRRLCCA